jgi:hypothetical protein
MDLKETGWVSLDWIYLAVAALVNTAISLLFL